MIGCSAVARSLFMEGYGVTAARLTLTNYAH
jgi:hypothetical protein